MIQSSLGAACTLDKKLYLSDRTGGNFGDWEEFRSEVQNICFWMWTQRASTGASTYDTWGSGCFLQSCWKYFQGTLVLFAKDLRRSDNFGHHSLVQDAPISGIDVGVPAAAWCISCLKPKPRCYRPVLPLPQWRVFWVRRDICSTTVLQARRSKRRIFTALGKPVNARSRCLCLRRNQWRGVNCLSSECKVSAMLLPVARSAGSGRSKWLNHFSQRTRDRV